MSLIQAKRDFLLSCLDPDTFSLLRNLFGSTDVTGQPFDDLIDKLSAHFKSSTYVQAARYSFYKCTMQPGQSYPEWVESLRGIAKDCNVVCKSEACHHCSYVDEQIRNVIIQNTPHAEIRRWCLIEPNISLNDVMKKAILYMRTLETDQLLTGSSTTAVNKMTSQYKRSLSGAHLQRISNQREVSRKDVRTVLKFICQTIALRKAALVTNAKRKAI